MTTTKKPIKQFFTWFKDETLREALIAHTVPFSSLPDALKSASGPDNHDNQAYVVIDETHATVFDSEVDNVQLVIAQGE